MDAAQRLMRDGTPFAQLTVEQLAAEAEMARSTFYFHFADKGALVHGLGETLLADLSERAAALWADRPPDRAAIEAAIRGVMHLYRERYPVFAAITETAVTDATVLSLLSERLDAISVSLAAKIEIAQELGVARPVLLPETAAALVTLLERTCYFHLRDADDATLDRYVQVLTDIVWHTLFAGA